MKYTLTFLIIKYFLFQLVDESNAEITLTNFQNDVSKYDFILKCASYANLWKAVHFLKQQNDEIYNDTKEMLAKIFPKRVSSFYKEVTKTLDQKIYIH